MSQIRKWKTLQKASIDSERQRVTAMKPIDKHHTKHAKNKLLQTHYRNTT